jgi:tRNA threonylcarbamoyl adenosine modification protein (Sua5/YciO/YrdC/YwlC family)
MGKTQIPAAGENSGDGESPIFTNRIDKGHGIGIYFRLMIVSINPQNPQKRLIDRVSEILDRGGLIAYPTDTFYGIGCDLMNKKGIQLIHKLKNRPLKKPFSIICDSLKGISHYAQVSNYAYKTMKRCLPGPYTFILEATQLVPKIMLTKRKTIGIRVPDNRICLAIVKALGRPIISTSAGYDNPYDIETAYAPRLGLVIDGGVLYPDPSSVISLIDNVPEVIREGKGDVSLFL